MTTLSIEQPVIALVQKHQRRFESRRWVSLAGNWLNSWLSLRIAMAGMHIDISYCEDQAVWFRGAAVSVDQMDRTAVGTLPTSTIERLHRMEASISRSRERLLAIQLERRSQAPTSFDAAVARYAHAMSDLFEGVRDLRGALQALEADLSAMAQAEHRVCSTPEQLEAELSALIG